MSRLHDKLMYMVMLRQIGAAAPELQAAYKRLEQALIMAGSRHPRSVILDWLEAELVGLKRSGADRGEMGSLLLNEAVALSKATSR